MTETYKKHKINRINKPSKMIERGPDRRNSLERRADIRDASFYRRFSWWLRSFINPRLGIDRRQGIDRRKNRRFSDKISPQSSLTQEEINQLIGSAD